MKSSIAFLVMLSTLCVSGSARDTRGSPPNRSENGAGFASVLDSIPRDQTVAAGEYFLNSDPGEGLGTPIGGSYGAQDVPATIDLSGLADGTVIYVRFRSSDGKWGGARAITYHPPYPTQVNGVVAGEYFVNPDPGEGNGTPISASYGAQEVSASLDLTGLNDGDVISVRFKSSNGLWNRARRLVYRVPYPSRDNMVIAAEYFVNDDPGPGHATPITAGLPSQVFSATIVPPGLAPGDVVYARTMSSNGVWGTARGIVAQSPIAMAGNTLLAGEYFLNSDPGEGNATPIGALYGSPDVTTSISPAGLTPGAVLYARFRSSNGIWGKPRALAHSVPLPIRLNTLVAGEYFLNADSGAGSGIPIAATYGSDTVSGAIQFSNLAAGSVIYARFKSSNGSWNAPSGIVYGSEFIGPAGGLWSDAASWRGGRIPSPEFPVVIPGHAVVDSLPRDSIRSLRIESGGLLEFSPGVSALSVLTSTDIDSNSAIQLPSSQDSIICYGSWTNRGDLRPGKSSIIFAGDSLKTIAAARAGSPTGNVFYDLSIAGKNTGARGNLRIRNHLTLDEPLAFQRLDTVFVDTGAAPAIRGSGTLTRCTVRRMIEPGIDAGYRFESESTYVRFRSSGTVPSSVTMTAYPDTNPSSFPGSWTVIPSHVDTASNTISADSVSHFTLWAIGIPRPRMTESKGALLSPADTLPLIRRIYRITAEGVTAGFAAQLALRYDQSEVPGGLSEDSLVLLRSDFPDGVNGREGPPTGVPDQFRLEQNYPNPFNPSTVIRFQVPVQSRVTIRIYDILGQAVATLVDEIRNAGDGSATFSTGGLASGVYFCRMEASSTVGRGKSFRQVRKMLVMR